MIVRFGYVAMSALLPNASPSKTMTATRFSQLADREAALRRLERLAEENLHNCMRLLRHNSAHDIQVFRFSSRLIPLATHEITAGWNPMAVLAPAFAEVGDYVQQHGMRTSLHPDHFTVLTSPRDEVYQYSLRDLRHQSGMLAAMGLDERAKCNIHIGGTYGDKMTALHRFCERCGKLDPAILSRLTLENDDKTYTALETLETCEKVGVPMVLDIHHHQVNPGNGEQIPELWLRIRETWDAAGIPPKIHASSPKSASMPKAHADYVDPEPLLTILKIIAPETPALDVMIEAKSERTKLCFN